MRDHGATALSHAVGYRDWEFVECLLERGADPDAHDGIAFRQILDIGRDKDYPTGKEEPETGPAMLKFRELLNKSRVKSSGWVKLVVVESSNMIAGTPRYP